MANSGVTHLQRAKLAQKKAEEALLKVQPHIFQRAQADMKTYAPEAIDYNGFLRTIAVDIKFRSDLKTAIFKMASTLKDINIFGEIFKHGPIAIYFNNDIDNSYWDPVERLIAIRFKGDFKKLINLMLNLPVPFNLFIPEHFAAYTIIFELYNAAWMYAEKPEVILINHQLMFSSAKDYALFVEHVEFEAQTQGKPYKEKQELKDGQREISDFNDWFDEVHMVDKFNKVLSHSKMYEDSYNAILEKDKKAIQAYIQDFVASPSDYNTQINILKELDKLKNVICPEIQKEVELEAAIQAVSLANIIEPEKPKKLRLGCC